MAADGAKADSIVEAGTVEGLEFGGRLGVSLFVVLLIGIGACCLAVGVGLRRAVGRGSDRYLGISALL